MGNVDESASARVCSGTEKTYTSSPGSMMNETSSRAAGPSSLSLYRRVTFLYNSISTAVCMNCDFYAAHRNSILIPRLSTPFVDIFERDTNGCRSSSEAT